MKAALIALVASVAEFAFAVPTASREGEGLQVFRRQDDGSCSEYGRLFTYENLLADKKTCILRGSDPESCDVKKKKDFEDYLSTCPKPTAGQGSDGLCSKYGKWFTEKNTIEEYTTCLSRGKGKKVCKEEHDKSLESYKSTCEEGSEAKEEHDKSLEGSNSTCGGL
ncbi:hypothetical protein G3M48_006490 [Beauveria asiatica]|uniref:Secreted protein n=1 Tax=Beauveria asiatica TaxID=1069075 RepID=A0AAW0RP71_9HYPO